MGRYQLALCLIHSTTRRFGGLVQEASSACVLVARELHAIRDVVKETTHPNSAYYGSAFRAESRARLRDFRQPFFGQAAEMEFGQAIAQVFEAFFGRVHNLE